MQKVKLWVMYVDFVDSGENEFEFINYKYSAELLRHLSLLISHLN